MGKNRINFDDEVLTAFGGDGGGGGGSCGPSSCSSGAGSSNGGSSSSVSMCTSASVGGQSISTCISSDGTTSVTTCVGTPGPIGAQLCQTTTTPSITSAGRDKAESAWANSNEFSGSLSSGSGASSLKLAAPIAVSPFVFSKGWIGGKVICTELYRNGHIDHKVWAADIRYSRKNFSEQTMRGYHYWGIPFVRLMQKSKLISKLVKHPTRWFAEDIAYRMGVLSKPNNKGWIIREVIFRPACYVIGFFAVQKDWRSLWNTQPTKS